MAQPEKSLSLQGKVLSKFFKSLTSKETGLFSAVGTASVIGLHMVSGVLVGGVIGYFLDEWLGTGPWLKLVFFVLGVAAGFYNVYLDTKRLLREQSSMGVQPGNEDKDASKTKTETEN